MKDNISFRNKVVLKFMPKINDILKTKNNKNIKKLVLISSLLSLILAKLPKEVNNLNRFFKKKTIVPNKKGQGSKSYTQASLIGNIARETLKIKEMFPKLQASKIKNIQNIIHEDNKLKPHINMTMKGPLCKQVIVSMNNKNKREVKCCYCH